MRKYKQGDKVRCKPGFNTGEDSGGSGYKPNRVFTVKRVIMNMRCDILWPEDQKYKSGCGVYAEAVELAEIEYYEVY